MIHNPVPIRSYDEGGGNGRAVRGGIITPPLVMKKTNGPYRGANVVLRQWVARHLRKMNGKLRPYAIKRVAAGAHLPRILAKKAQFEGGRKESWGRTL